MTMLNSLITPEHDTVSPFPLPSSPSHVTADPGDPPAPHLQAGLSADDVHHRALVARAHLAKAQRALCFWLVETEKRGLYKCFGCSSVFQYGELCLELAPHTIAEYLRSGREMEKLPLLAEACEKGEISFSKLREISRVVIPDTEKAWLAIARISTYRQIEKMVPLTPKGGLPPVAGLVCHNETVLMSKQYVKGQQDVQGEQCMDRGWIVKGEQCVKGEHTVKIEMDTSEEQDVRGERGVNNEQHVKGERGAQHGENELMAIGTLQVEAAGAARYRTKIVLELDNDRLAIIMSALEKAQKETGERDRGTLLAHMARAFLEGGSSSRGEGVPYRVTVHHVPERGVAWIEGTAGPLHVTQNTVEEAFCDAEILDLGETGSTKKEINCRRPVCDENPEHDPGRDQKTGKKDDSSRRGPHLRRTIPTTLRRQVLERDGHQCTAPGCGHRRHLSLHHIEPVAGGGRDMAQNLTTVCSRCHRALHWGRLFLEEEAPGGFVWRTMKGAVMKGSDILQS
jgi:hypothetical protein